MGNNSEHEQRLASQSAPAATLGDVTARLDAIEHTLARIEAAMRPRYVVTPGPVREPQNELERILRHGDSIGEPDDASGLARAVLGRREPPAVPSGIVDADDRAALQRMASNVKHEPQAMQFGAPLVDEETGILFTHEVTRGDVHVQGEDNASKAGDPHADYWADFHCSECGAPQELGVYNSPHKPGCKVGKRQASVDTRRESPRPRRKWWRLWLW